MANTQYITPGGGPTFVPPELPDNKVVAFIKRQPRFLKIIGLIVVGISVLLAIVFSYVSLFEKHSKPSTAADTTKTSPADSNPAKLENKSAPEPTAAPVSQAPAPGGSSKSSSNTPVFPSAILNLTNWKLTIPTKSSSSDVAAEIVQPQLATYISPYFQVDATRDGVQFEAPVNGATTSGSQFPRSELREMTNNGQQEASWSTTSGVSTMTVREAVTHLPSARPQLVAAQIHGSSAYVILVRLNGSSLFVEGPNGKNLGELNSNYGLGTVFTIQIVASGGHITVFYNGVKKVDFINSSSGNYFKAGCYTQSNSSYGDNSSAYGQTIIYSLNVSHT